MSAPAPLNASLSDSAQRQLAALRVALEDRLATLEEALADPSRGESLEGLILDLSRAATEEAQAAAAQACLEAQANADRGIAEVRATATATLEAAQVALQQEQAANSELRHKINHAQDDIDTLQSEKRAEARATLEQFAAEAERTRIIVVGIEQEAADAKAQLKAAQASIVDLRRAAERAEGPFKERVAVLEREQAEARLAHDALAAELARERIATAALHLTHAEMQSHFEESLEAERVSSADLRRAVERAGEEVAEIGPNLSHSRAALEALEKDLTREREQTAALKRELVELKRHLEAERTSSADLRQAVERATEEVATIGPDLLQSRAAREGLDKELAREREQTAALKRELVESKRHLEAERASSADLRQAVERATEKAATSGPDPSQSHAAREGLDKELALEREQTARLKREHAELKRHLEAERASSADLREAVERAEEEVATIGPDLSQSRAAREGLDKELARERELAAGLKQKLTRERELAAGFKQELARGRELAAGLEQELTREGEVAAGLKQELAREGQLAAGFKQELTRERELAAGFKQELAGERELAAGFEQELTRERELAAELEQELTRKSELAAELEQELTRERELAAELEQGLARERELAAGFKQELAARAAPEKELTREREAAAGLAQELAEIRAQLAAAQQAARDAEGAAEYADERLKSLAPENGQTDADQAQMAAQLTTALADSAAAAAAAADAQQLLAAARKEAKTLKADVDARQKRLDTLQRDRDTLAAELKRVRLKGGTPANFDLVVVGVDEIAPPPPEDEEWQAMRLATRYFFKKEIEIFIDGESGEMCDISVAGCQLMSATELKPGQEVHIVLPSEQTPVACTGQIVWVRVEPPKKRGQPPRYRAGASFTKVDKLAIEAFAVQRGATS